MSIWKKNSCNLISKFALNTGWPIFLARSTYIRHYSWFWETLYHNYNTYYNKYNTKAQWGLDFCFLPSLLLWEIKHAQIFVSDVILQFLLLREDVLKNGAFFEVTWYMWVELTKCFSIYLAFLFLFYYFIHYSMFNYT